jgi:hypothetical protein
MGRHTWLPGWPERIEAQVQALGYQDLAGFASARASSTYFDLAHELGGEVAPVQLAWLLLEDALTKETVLEFARSSLVRELRHYATSGWDLSDAGRLRSAKAYAAWLSSMPNEYLGVGEATWARVKNHAYDRWLPVSAEDPVVQAAFGALEREWRAIRSAGPPGRPTRG